MKLYCEAELFSYTVLLLSLWLPLALGWQEVQGRKTPPLNVTTEDKFQIPIFRQYPVAGSSALFPLTSSKWCLQGAPYSAIELTAHSTPVAGSSTLCPVTSTKWNQPHSLSSGTVTVAGTVSATVTVSGYRLCYCFRYCFCCQQQQ